MARQVMLSDDFDGSTPAETVEFAISLEPEGKVQKFEVDLNEEHAGTFREFVKRFAEAGREKGSPKRRQGDPPRDNKAIREWARANGFENVSDRGVIAKEILDAYNAAHSSDNGEAPVQLPVTDQASASEIPTLA